MLFFMQEVIVPGRSAVPTLDKELPCQKEIPYTPQLQAIMITSKLTTKAQTTIPQPVRATLHLQAGDEPVNNPAKAGLPVPSVIRAAKIAAIETADTARLGPDIPCAVQTSRQAAWTGARFWLGS